MAYVRGNKEDLMNKALGNTGWGYEDVSIFQNRKPMNILGPFMERTGHM